MNSIKVLQFTHWSNCILTYICFKWKVKLTAIKDSVFDLIATAIKAAKGERYVFRALLNERPFYLNCNNVNPQQCRVDNNHTIN